MTRKTAGISILILLLSFGFVCIYYTPLFFSVVWTIIHKRTLTLDQVTLDVPFLWFGNTPYKWNREMAGLDNVTLLRANTGFNSQKKYKGTVLFLKKQLSIEEFKENNRKNKAFASVLTPVKDEVIQIKGIEGYGVIYRSQPPLQKKLQEEGVDSSLTTEIIALPQYHLMIFFTALPEERPYLDEILQNLQFS